MLSGLENLVIICPCLYSIIRCKLWRIWFEQWTEEHIKLWILLLISLKILNWNIYVFFIFDGGPELNIKDGYEKRL